MKVLDEDLVTSDDIGYAHLVLDDFKDGTEEQTKEIELQFDNKPAGKVFIRYLWKPTGGVQPIAEEQD